MVDLKEEIERQTELRQLKGRMLRYIADDYARIQAMPLDEFEKKFGNKRPCAVCDTGGLCERHTPG